MKRETVEPNQPSTSQAALESHAGLILAVVISACFLDVVDFSVVQVALPTIQREFTASLASVQWIVGVHGLWMAGFLMVSGRAGDVFGRKRVFVVGIVAFAASSRSSSGRESRRMRGGARRSEKNRCLGVRDIGWRHGGARRVVAEVLE